MTAKFDPDVYGRFASERQQPFFDLLKLIAALPGMRVVDLGCGTGQLTERLHQELRARHTQGVDRSPAMLERARARATPSLEFLLGRIEHFMPSGQLDLLWSNAALHWVSDHPTLFERLTGLLAAGGQLAVQVPANEDHPSHQVARWLARQPPFAAALENGPRISPVLPVERYASLLAELEFAEQHVRLQVYVHRLPSARWIVDWVKGSLLTWYEERLDADLFGRFVDEYEKHLLERLGRPGTSPFIYTYKRILIWARR